MWLIRKQQVEIVDKDGNTAELDRTRVLAYVQNLAVNGEREGDIYSARVNAINWQDEVSRRYKSYIDSLLEFQQPVENFLTFIERFRNDSNMLITYSASEALTEKFKENYEERAEAKLDTTNHDVNSETQGNKLNVVCSKQSVLGLSFSGVSFKSFFGGDELVLAYEDRAGMFWALIDCGFRQGSLADQDQDRITRNTAQVFGLVIS